MNPAFVYEANRVTLIERPAPGLDPFSAPGVLELLVADAAMLTPKDARELGMALLRWAQHRSGERCGCVVRSMPHAFCATCARRFT